MMKEYLSAPETRVPTQGIYVIRHAEVCKRLQISSAKLFDMIARGQFLKPFTLIPGGRAVGWLEEDVNKWILKRKDMSEMAPTLRGTQ
jgi:predicted DNA-binding transcriptional regulator AlpA